MAKRSASPSRRAGCSIQRALDVVGEKWSLLVLREAFYGVRRFGDLQRNLGCARNVLSDRLATLVAAGVLDRVPYREPGQRARAEYVLTDKGAALSTALAALMEWGDRFEAAPGGPPVELRHRGCDAVVHVTLACESGHHHVAPRELVPRRR